MAIPDEDIAKVREATDISALIGQYSPLKRVGQRYVGLCPFHSEKSPSFSVNVEEGLFYCFGCQERGDAISFVQKIEHCSFVEALERLAGRAGIEIRDDHDRANDATRGRRQALYAALESATDFYHRYLLESPDAGAARRYLRSRGYDGTIVRTFRLGFAPRGFDELSRALTLAPAVLREAGLAYENSRQKMQDVMRERVIFPILDPMGKVIALGGRVLPDELRSDSKGAGPKYRNSPESAIYSKSSTLYGLNWSKAEIVTTGEAVVCEGYTDVIGFAQAGISRAVATCGTALTESHFRLLSRFAKRIVLCFDQDTAGQSAAARLYDFERRHEVELYVAALPAGADPAELARRDPEGLNLAISSSKPFLGFVVDRAIGGLDQSTPEARAHAAQRAIVAIAEHPNDLVRDQYIVQVADRTRQDLTLLRSALERQRAKEKETPKESDPSALISAASNGPTESARPVLARRETLAEPRAGRDGLLLAIHRPEEVAPYLEGILFQDPRQREVFDCLLATDELHEAIERCGPEAAKMLSRLAVSDDAGGIDLEGTLIELVRIAATTATHDLEVKARLGRDSPEVIAAISSRTRWLKAELELLRDPPEASHRSNRAFEGALRILDWLRESPPVQELT